MLRAPVLAFLLVLTWGLTGLGERATGFGVALLLALFGQASEDPLLKMVSPLGIPTAKASSGDQMERDSKRRRLV
ncbi:putative aminopeptidase NPEPL1 [Silurus asotus]|uniref:Aminopeptidase NPEPL1 n=1 Tax=Silurus asotus TaxID=30991 RepID=A0AAD5FTJ7_SILAS|nr:putative aminopeptidase NPEPL1 [Silurus asotus]